GAEVSAGGEEGFVGDQWPGEGSGLFRVCPRCAGIAAATPGGISAALRAEDGCAGDGGDDGLFDGGGRESLECCTAGDWATGWWRGDGGVSGKVGAGVWAIGAEQCDRNAGGAEGGGTISLAEADQAIGGMVGCAGDSRRCCLDRVENFGKVSA